MTTGLTLPIPYVWCLVLCCHPFARLGVEVLLWVRLGVEAIPVAVERQALIFNNCMYSLGMSKWDQEGTHRSTWNGQRAALPCLIV